MKTLDGQKIKVNRVNWNDAIMLIDRIDHEFSDLLKQVKIDDVNIYFYKASYNFGDTIIHNKNTFLSLENGNKISFNDKNLPIELVKDLSYDLDSENPLGIILSKTSELYTNKNNLTCSSSLLRQNDIFGIPRALDKKNIDRSSVTNFNLNAGAKSLFMLSKISNRSAYAKIKQDLNIDITTPISASDHWQTFVEIATKIKSDWQCEILFFSREFINALKLREWSSVALYLYQLHSNSYTVWHSIAGIWHKDIEFIHHKKRLAKYNKNLFDIVKYIFMLSANGELGYEPLLDDEQAPVSLLKKTYHDLYGLENPIIMGLVKFDYRNINQLPVYVSLNQGNMISENISSSGKYTNMSALSDLIYLNQSIRSAILDDKVLMNNQLKELISHTKVSYYHNNSNIIHNIQDSLNIPLEDTRFCSNHDSFPIRSVFLNGCIKISRI